MESPKSSPTQLLLAAGAQPCRPGPGPGGPSSHARRGRRCQSGAEPRGARRGYGAAGRRRPGRGSCRLRSSSGPGRLGPPPRGRRLCSPTPRCGRAWERPASARPGRALRRRSRGAAAELELPLPGAPSVPLSLAQSRSWPRPGGAARRRGAAPARALAPSARLCYLEVWASRGRLRGRRGGRCGCRPAARGAREEPAGSPASGRPPGGAGRIVLIRASRA